MKPKNDSQVLSVFKVLLAGILFGTAGLAYKYAPEGSSPVTLGIVRLFIGSLFLILILPLIDGSRRNILQLSRKPLVWVMAIFSASYQPFFFGATDRNGVALSTLLTVGCIPIFTGLVGRIFLKEKIRVVWVLATLLAICGLIIRSMGQIEFNNLTGIFMSLAAGLSVSFYLNAAKVELRKGKYGMELPAMAYFLGSILLIPFLWGNSFSWVLQPQGFITASYIGIVTMAIANALQISGLRRLPPGPTATLMLADPFTATILGVVVLHEKFGLLPFLGIAIVGFSIVWQSVAQVKSSYV